MSTCVFNVNNVHVTPGVPTISVYLGGPLEPAPVCMDGIIFFWAVYFNILLEQLKGRINISDEC